MQSQAFTQTAQDFLSPFAQVTGSFLTFFLFILISIALLKLFLRFDFPKRFLPANPRTAFVLDIICIAVFTMIMMFLNYQPLPLWAGTLIVFPLYFALLNSFVHALPPNPFRKRS